MRSPFACLPWLGLFFIFDAHVESARAGTNIADSYYVRSFSMEDGFPNYNIHCLLQTRDGYLWIGCQDGLAQFDGLNFKIYAPNTEPVFPTADCLSLAEDENGDLWVGTTEGLLKKHGNEWRHFPPRPESFSKFVDCLSPRRGGGVWAGTREGLFEVFNDHMEECTNSPTYALYPMGRGKAVGGVIQDNNGTVWISNDAGVARREAGEEKFNLVFVASQARRGESSGSLLLDRSGSVWWGNSWGTFKVRSDQITSFPQPPIGDRAFGSAFAEDTKGALWIGTSGATGLNPSCDGLFRLENGTYKKFSIPALEHSSISSLLADNEGNIWVATKTEGLVRLQPRRLLTCTTADGLANNDVWSIAEGLDHSVWIGTPSGVCRWQNGSITNYSVPGGQEDTSVFVTREGEVWSAGMLNRFQDGGFQPVYLDPNHKFARGVRSVHQDRSGNIWMASARTLLRYRDGVVEYVYSTNLNAALIIGIQEDAFGRIWFGTRGAGLNCLEKGAVRTYTTREGLTSNLIGPLLAEADGTVWFGSDRGLNRLKNGRFTPITEKDGLGNNLTFNILEDDFGWFWINSRQGIYRVRKKDLNDFAEGRLSKIFSILYKEEGRALSNFGNGGTFPNSCKTSDGRLWFPTAGGVVVIDPKTVLAENHSPKVIIEQIIANRESILGGGPPQPSKERFRFKPGAAQSLEIRYTAVSLSGGKSLKFQNRLEGEDTDWIEAGERRAAFYTDLRPGNYSFQVRAMDGEGNTGVAKIPFLFNVAPHFYQTSMFYVGCGAAVLALAAAFMGHRLRVQRRILQLERAHALDQQRSRIARDMHDDLGATLTQIQLLSCLAEKEAPGSSAAQQHIQKISAASQRVIRDVDEMVWAVNPRNDKVSELCDYMARHTQEYLLAAGLRCRLDLPEVLPDRTLTSDVRHSLFLAVKEALHNVVKHAGANQVQLSFRANSQGVEIDINDDGKGFDPAILMPGLPKPLPPSNSGNLNGQARGDGLINIRQRIVELGGTCEWITGNGHGTSLRIRVPLSGQADAARQSQTT